MRAPSPKIQFASANDYNMRRVANAFEFMGQVCWLIITISVAIMVASFAVYALSELGSYISERVS